jgi:hypothetical protein
MVNELPAQFDNQTSTVVNLSCTSKATTPQPFFADCAFRFDCHRLETVSPFLHRREVGLKDDE